MVKNATTVITWAARRVNKGSCAGGFLEITCNSVFWWFIHGRCLGRTRSDVGLTRAGHRPAPYKKQEMFGCRGRSQTCPLETPDPEQKEDRTDRCLGPIPFSLRNFCVVKFTSPPAPLR